MPYLDDKKEIAAFVQRCVRVGFHDVELLEGSDDWPDYPSGLCVAVTGGVALCYRRNGRFAVGAVLPEYYVQDGLLFDDCREAFLSPGAVTAKKNGQFSKVPCVPGQLVWVTSKPFCCFGRAVDVTDEGRVLTLRKFDGELIDAAVDPKARRFCSAVPVGLLQGAAALMMKGVYEGEGYYTLSARVTKLEAATTGWKRTKSGKYMLAGSIPRYAKVAEHTHVQKALRDGLQEPREWLDVHLEQIAAMECLTRGLKASDAFLTWFRMEWAERRRATWEHANAFEAYVQKYEKR